MGSKFHVALDAEIVTQKVCIWYVERERWQYAVYNFDLTAVIMVLAEDVFKS